MGVGPAIFESSGQRTEHVIPGTFSRSKSVSSSNGISAGNHVVLGKSTGGKPNTLLSFASLAEAKEVLVGDELLNAVAYAFNGSNIYIPQRVYAMRVNNGTQSTLTLKSGGDEGTPILKITSWDWGFHTNQLKLWLQAGTDEHTRKISVAYKDEETTYDNVGRPSMSLSYIGEGTAATVSVNSTSIVLSATSEMSTVDEYTFNFDDYATLESMVTRINDTKVYTASLIDNRLNVPSRELDTVTSQDITETATLYSDLEALIEALKLFRYIGDISIISAESRIVPDNTSGYEYFTGGEAGEYTVAQWQEAITALEAEDIQIISTPSTDDAVHTLISSHCEAMSSVANKKERTCILGGPLNEQTETAIKKAKGFNSKLVSYVTDNAYTSNPITGKEEMIPGSLLAVMLAGMESSMSINEPLTNKTLKVLGFGKKRLQPDMEKLLYGGVMVCNFSPDEPSDPVVIRALTTFQGDNLLLNERSMVREDLYMNRDLRKRFHKGIGTSTTPSIDDVVQTLVIAAREWAISGYIIPKGGQNVWNIKVRVSGDKKYLDFDRYLTAPNNFVFINIKNHEYSSDTASQEL